MFLVLYSEINIFCILLLASVLHKILTGFKLENNQRLFSKVLISLIIFLYWT